MIWETSALKKFLSVSPEERADLVSEMNEEDAHIIQCMQALYRYVQGLVEQHGPAFMHHSKQVVERLQRGVEEMEETTAAGGQRDTRKVGYYEEFTPSLGLSPEQWATLLSVMNEEALGYLEGMEDATVFRRTDLRMEQIQSKEALPESCPGARKGRSSPPSVPLTKSEKRDASRVLHGGASSPTPYSWSGPLLLLASLVFFQSEQEERQRASSATAGNSPRSHSTSFFCTCGGALNLSNLHSFWSHFAQ